VCFGALNYAVLSIYLVAMVGVGVLLAGRQRTTTDYFLAGRNMPWLAVTLSIFASLVSAVSYVGVPGLVYTDSIALLAGIFMLPVVAPVVILWFCPLYRRLNVTTSYEYIYHRFGQNARYAVSGLFILGRLGWLGTVIFAPALALSTVTSLDLRLSLVIMGGVGTLYTVLGGLAAVIWTDVVQFFVLAFGAPAVPRLAICGWPRS